MTSADSPKLQPWALVLGASSGFGAATAIALARDGMNVFGVHLDRKATLPSAEKVKEDILQLGREAIFFNINAADAERRAETLKTVAETLERSRGTVRVLLHSLAFGTLLPYIGEKPEDGISPRQMAMTLDVMAHSLVYWVQDLVCSGLMGRGGRIFAMTSGGGRRVLPHYGAVSAAKAALESHIRQLAMELASRGVTANAIRAGVTDTPALRKIPGYELIAATAKGRNPGGRLTTPEDVGKVIAVLCREETAWVTGNIIGVDGGEDIVG